MLAGLDGRRASWLEGFAVGFVYVCVCGGGWGVVVGGKGGGRGQPRTDRHPTTATDRPRPTDPPNAIDRPPTIDTTFLTALYSKQSLARDWSSKVARAKLRQQQQLQLTRTSRKLDPREIRTPNLLIWSQTRYRCAIEPMSYRCNRLVDDLSARRSLSRSGGQKS